MIVDRPGSHFIFIYHPAVFYGYNYITYRGRPLTNKEFLEHWGKWIVLGTREKLDELARKLDPYVERGEIPCIKYDRHPPEELDLEVKQKLRSRFVEAGDEAGLKECVMLVFCDDRQREEVWRILAGLGVELKAWVYERETIELWLPGGLLLERWIARNCSSEAEAFKVRQESLERFGEIFRNEHAVYRGWPQ